MKKKQSLRLLKVCPVALLFAFGATLAGAQEPAETPENRPPKPAAGGIWQVQQEEQNQQDPGALQPDTRPLTGVQNATLGKVASEHSYWIPGIQYGNTIQND